MIFAYNIVGLLFIFYANKDIRPSFATSINGYEYRKGLRHNPPSIVEETINLCAI